MCARVSFMSGLWGGGGGGKEGWMFEDTVMLTMRSSIT